jgi:hypothetical protein
MMYDAIHEAREKHHSCPVWWQRIGESEKPSRSWAAYFSESAKQTNFWDMAMALDDELASFNIVLVGLDVEHN